MLKCFMFSFFTVCSQKYIQALIGKAEIREWEINEEKTFQREKQKWVCYKCLQEETGRASQMARVRMASWTREAKEDI